MKTKSFQNNMILRISKTISWASHVQKVLSLKEIICTRYKRSKFALITAKEVDF